MALFDPNLNLEQILGNQANTKSAGVQDQYAQKRRRLIGQQGASGRLGSGVSNYPLADLDAAEIGDQGDIYSSLAETLGQIPAGDWLGNNEYGRKMRLSKQIGDINKPSSLEEALSALGQATNIGSKFAAFA